MTFNFHQLEFFFTHKIWFVDERKYPPFKRYAFNALRKLVLTIECYLNKNLGNHASALTYSSILATVPILAIIFAIGRGLGYGAVIEQEIKKNLSVNQEFADMVLNFINSYLAHTQSGIFIGFGLLLLLYTVIQLTGSIETALNSIWRVKNQRSIYRQITDYISVFLLLPILIIITSGLSIFLATIAQDYPNFMVLSTTVKILIALSPYVLSGFLFTALYMYMPNFVPAYAFSNIVDGKVKGKETLEKVILSEKTKNIEDAAFKGCTRLKVCQIQKKSAPNLLPEALADSVTAIFVPRGSSDAYTEEEKWKDFAIIEGDPVTASVEIGAMDNLQNEITRLGLQPKEINFLTVKGKLDENDFKLIRDYMPNLVDIDISQTNATVLPDFTFTQKKYLLRVALPNNLQSIGERAFSNCKRLAGVLVLPPHVTAIKYGAFLGCDKLKQVVATNNKLTTIGDNLFGNGANKLVY